MESEQTMKPGKYRIDAFIIGENIQTSQLFVKGNIFSVNQTEQVLSRTDMYLIKGPDKSIKANEQTVGKYPVIGFP